LEIAMATELFIMGPHADDLDQLFFFQHLIDQAMLNINSTGICTGQISYQLMVRWRAFEGVLLENIQKLFCLCFKPNRGYIPGVFTGLLGKDYIPGRQSSPWTHFSTGVCKPSRIDSLIPGIDRR
jgi:hypothetical protein